MLGKIEGRRRRGRQRMRWLNGITDSMDMVWVNSGSWWWTGRSAAIHGVTMSRTRLSDRTELIVTLAKQSWSSRKLPPHSCFFISSPLLHTTIQSTLSIHRVVLKHKPGHVNYLLYNFQRPLDTDAYKTQFLHPSQTSSGAYQTLFPALLSRLGLFSLPAFSVLVPQPLLFFLPGTLTPLP